MKMNLKDFNYNLPQNLIAKNPVSPRDHSRLLVLDRENNKIEDDNFNNLPSYLKKDDLIITNTSKVINARLLGQKESTKGMVEILLNHPISSHVWQALGKNLKINSRIKFENSFALAVVQKKENESYLIRFNMSKDRLMEELKKIGQVPLPPYILRQRNSGPVSLDQKNYQTVYAKSEGSVAAPTAGLHFTEELLQKIRDKGPEIASLTLHVGLGTFAPVKEENIENHRLHKEFYSIEKETINKIIQAKKDKRRIVAVGTTTVRVLEHIFKKIKNGASVDRINEGWTDIFIYPPYQFLAVDAMITNFHLPKSSLLMLISAFAGTKNIQKAYQHAIDEEYRFYSYGDAMLIS